MKGLVLVEVIGTGFFRSNMDLAQEAVDEEEEIVDIVEDVNELYKEQAEVEVEVH